MGTAELLHREAKVPPDEIDDRNRRVFLAWTRVLVPLGKVVASL